MTDVELLIILSPVTIAIFTVWRRSILATLRAMTTDPADNAVREATTQPPELAAACYHTGPAAADLIAWRLELEDLP